MIILLIEDDAIEVLKFKRSLSKLEAQHEILEAQNGKEALAILETQKPHIILLDLNMPKMNGLEFLKRLRSLKLLDFIPTIILTTSVNSTDLKTAYTLGVAGYILKPLRYEDYVIKIAALLNYWQQNELVQDR